MSIALVKRRVLRGFTLLEIMLAVAILGMMAMVIYRFVASNIIVMRISSEENAAEARYTGFIRLITAQLQDLPNGVGALSGEPFKFNDQARDEIAWICGNGPGLATRYGAGEFLVRMRLKPVNDQSDRMEVGLLRKPRETAEGSTEGQSWIPLLGDVRSLQVRYFDPRVNVWKENWTDPGLPPLVKLTVDLGGRASREAIIALRRTPLQLAQQLPIVPAVPQPGQGGLPGQVPPRGQAPPTGQAPPKGQGQNPPPQPPRPK
jgi:prepilin-type N-terminal cleavage/methylation domain-containing protein